MMKSYEDARAAIEARFRFANDALIYKCVGVTEDEKNATVEVIDRLAGDDYVIHCQVVWKDKKRHIIDRLSYR